MRKSVLLLLLLARAAAPGGVEVGDSRLSVVFSDASGWPETVRVAGETVLRPSAVPPFESDVAVLDRHRTNGVWRTGDVRPKGVRRLDARTACSTVEAGPWTIDCWVELHPESLMVRRWYEIAQHGAETRKLKTFWAGFGELPAAKGGEMFKPVGWPPGRWTVKSAYHDVYCGWGDFPAMAAGGDGGWSAMVVPDLLHDYSDRALGYVFVNGSGWTLVSRHDIAGHVRRGVRQRFGDDWLVLRRGPADVLLGAVRDWQRACGQHVPRDRARGLHRTVLYSHDPRGEGEYDAPRTNGLAVTERYFPYLRALGADTIWLRPIENAPPYNPRDYYSVHPHVGTAADVRAFVDAAHRSGFKVWKDAVMHGGSRDCPRSRAHPEWLTWIDETGKTFDYWCYDYNWPTWVAYFADYVRHDTRLYGLDGWREDVPDGSRSANWNPAIPYARASFACLQGAMAQQRGIRAALRDVNPSGATLSEAGEAVFGNISDALYDQFPCHHVFPLLLTAPGGEVASWYGRFLHEKECCFLPGQVFCRYPESHDSVRAAGCYGRACANALMAACAWTRSVPLLHNGGEEGCFEAWRRIFRLRRELPELLDGTADYASVRAPEGVLAFLRERGETASVALVNFSGRRARGTVRWRGGAFETDLPAFGYDVVRVRGPHVREALGPEPPAFEPDVPGELAALPPVQHDTWTYFRFPGATRWYAHAADGSFDSPWFEHYEKAPWVTRTSRFGEHRHRRGHIRWRSAQHPFGYDRAHAEVGVIRGARALSLEGLGPGADVLVASAVEELGWKGLAIGVRGEAAGVRVREVPAAEALAFREPGTGDPRLTPEPGGWRYEAGRLRVRFSRSGALVGVWRRADGGWQEVAGAGGLFARLDSGREREQLKDWNATSLFARDARGGLAFVVRDGCLLPEGRGLELKVRYETELAFDDADRSFAVTTRARLDARDAGHLPADARLSCEWRQQTWGRGGRVALRGGADRQGADLAAGPLAVSVRMAP